MILDWGDYARAESRISMLRARCDRLRQPAADVRAAANAAIEVERLENRIDELNSHMRIYRDTLRRGPVATTVMEIIEIPDKLIARRIGLGWSQTKLAKACGQSRQVVSGYERSRFAGVSLKRLIQIDHVLRLEELRRRARLDDREITQGKEKLGVVAILGSEGVACPFRAADGEFEGKDER
ncbi:MAG TPA: helix-turn-helix transcriptional regulator [Drouetiella sp.]|jgi:transcriptional regulator with XRE-family HTH domain